LSSVTLLDALLARASDFRSGMVLPSRVVPASPSDIGGYFHAAVAPDPVFAWQTACGGIGPSAQVARRVAVAEALERYAAATCRFALKRRQELTEMELIDYHQFALYSPAQYALPSFPWKKPDPDHTLFGEVFSMQDHHPVWVPQELIGLGPKAGEAQVPSVSTGLAAHSNVLTALYSGLQELLERDALSSTWLNALPGRELQAPAAYHERVLQKQGEIRVFDFTQAWNPHPVVAVCGFLPQNNRRRYALGIACRGSYAEALDKAWREWLQGTVFAGYLAQRDSDSDEQLQSFEAHAVHYTRHPQHWAKIPLLQTTEAARLMPSSPRPQGSMQSSLRRLVEQLAAAGIRSYYRDLTTVDVREAGLTVVRVLSPDLSHLHGDERMPFLGGRLADVAWRYPALSRHPSLPFPNPYPHPLG
jgi:ribosomal protein S12 methylthiotransferase accessory factor